VVLPRLHGSAYIWRVMIASLVLGLLERNLLYTGVTRGRKLVVIVGQPKALAIAVRTVRSVKRLTHLAERLSALKGKTGPI
jgi:ATP-dependent exoDNAse (exonuclease V) alpha subunit